MTSFFAGKKVLVTGATGSIGSEIVRQILLQNPAVVRVFSRDEHKQFLMQQELQEHKNVRYLLGDVRDLSRLRAAMEDIDFVFHAAAYKHVPLCEYNSFEAVKTNVIGTQNVIDASLERNVERVVLISTDKAASPPNVMGATKLLAEKLMTSAMQSKGSRRTLFASVRFGNVLGSRGSVIPVFVRQIQQGGPVTVTDPEMLRFFMSISQAVGLTLTAMREMRGGELFILKMPVMRLGDLADILVEEVCSRDGIDVSSIQRKVIGVRPGEKLKEILMTEEEAYFAEERDDMFVVRSPQSLPQSEASSIKPKESAEVHTSAVVKPLSKEEVRVMLKALLSQL